MGFSLFGASIVAGAFFVWLGYPAVGVIIMLADAAAIAKLLVRAKRSAIQELREKAKQTGAEGVAD